MLTITVEDLKENNSPVGPVDRGRKNMSNENDGKENEM
jgi:hypothetical protein